MLAGRRNRITAITRTVPKHVVHVFRSLELRYRGRRGVTWTNNKGVVSVVIVEGLARITSLRSHLELGYTQEKAGRESGGMSLTSNFVLASCINAEA